MRVKLQLVMCNDKGDEETVTDVITLNKNNQHLSRHVRGLPDCGTPLHLKARSRRSFRTLFGTFQFDSPRLEHCDCTRRKTASFRPCRLC